MRIIALILLLIYQIVCFFCVTSLKDEKDKELRNTVSIVTYIAPLFACLILAL